MLKALTLPAVEKHDGVFVVRDDLTPGGTKARLFMELMAARPETEFVYASPAVGLAQLALAIAAYQHCRQATIFVAKRAQRTTRTEMAAAYGARIVEVSPGYFSLVEARARRYAEDRGAYLVPFGGAGAGDTITALARMLDMAPRTVWCAAGSGTLATALQKAWPEAIINAVEVGRPLSDNTSFNRTRSPFAFSQRCSVRASFPLDPFYEAKAWWALLTSGGADGETVFWNVAGP